jgi:hypothetical protein
MLTDPVEIEIISKARQKNVRDPNRSRAHFDRIFADFLPDELFAGADLIDLGPGQFDFGEMARARGATRIVGFDTDPAVVELGRHKGFEVVEGRLQQLRAADYPGGFHGVFCKFSINAFWATSLEEVRAHATEVARLVRPDGWSWIAPWNGVKEDQRTADEIASYLAAQVACFREHGYDAIELGDELSRYYGVHGAVANHALFTRNLALPERVASCAAL